LSVKATLRDSESLNVAFTASKPASGKTCGGGAAVRIRGE
jgi:hypothetical protein